MQARRQSNHVRALGAVGAGLLAAMLSACGGGGVPDATPPAPALPPAGFATIDAAGGSVQGIDGATVVVPAGALSTAVTIAIARDASEARPLPSALRPVGSIYAVTPHGTAFALEATVNIPFSPAFLRTGERPILLKGDPEGAWSVVRNVTVRDGMMTAKVAGFSHFVAAACAETEPTADCGFTAPVPVAGEATFGFDPLNSNLAPLTPTGSNVRIFQQADASAPVQTQIGWTIPPNSTLVTNACRSPSRLSIGLLLRTAFLYSIPGQAGNNRLALSPSFQWIPFDNEITAAELGRSFLFDYTVNVADWPTFSELPRLPPGAVRDARALHASLELRCEDAAGTSVILPTYVTPLVIAKGFPESPLNITENPPPLYGRLFAGASPRTGEMSASVFFGYEQSEYFLDGAVRWEMAMPGLEQFAVLPPLPSELAGATSLPQTVDGFFADGNYVSRRGEGEARVVGRTGAWANGARLRASACIARRINPSERHCATSRPALVTVATAYEQPRFTTHPASRTVTPGSQLTLRAAFEGLPTPREVKWEARTGSGGAWRDARELGFEVQMDPGSPAESRGATRLVRSGLESVQAGEAWQFRATYTTVGGTATSEVGNIVVGTAGAPPLLTLQPRDQIVAPGRELWLTAAALGSWPLSYQWYLDGIAIPGASGPGYYVNSFSAARAGNYRVEAVNAAGRVLSRVATVSVGTALPPGLPVPPPRPEILQQPASVSAAAGSDVSFSVTLASNALVPRYQWRFNGSAIAGATAPTLSLASVTTGLAGDYSVTITNSAGSVTSAVARLTVQAPSPGPVPPVLTAEPTGFAVGIGQSARLAVGATGSAPLAYQWQRNGVDLPGATASILTLVASGSAQAGDYTVKVTNAAGSVTSSPAGVVVLPPVVRIDGPLPQTVQVGSAATFSARVVSSQPVTCQWLRNDVPLLDGSNCATLTTPPVTSADNGAVFTLQATAGSEVATASAQLTTFVATVPPLTMTQQPPSSVSVIARIGRAEVTAAAVPRAGQGVISWEIKETSIYNTSCEAAESFQLWANSETISSVTERRLAFRSTCGLTARLINDGTTLALAEVTQLCGVENQFGWGGICARFRMRDAYADDGVLSNWVRINTTPHYRLTLPPSAATTEGGGLTLTAAVAGLDNRPDPVDNQGRPIAPALKWWIQFGNSYYPLTDWNGQPIGSDGQQIELIPGSNCRAVVALANSRKELRLSNVSAACHNAVFWVEGNDDFYVVNSWFSPEGRTQLSVDTIPAITAALTAQSTLTGGTAVFVSTAGGRPFPTLAWRINGQPIAAGPFAVGACQGVAALNASSGNNDGRLSLSNLSQGCSGSTVSVVATNRAGSSAPSTAVLTVNPAGTPPSIVQPLQPQSISAGGSVTFSVEATGTPTPTIAWTLNGTAVSNGAFNLAGCTGTAALGNGGNALSLSALSVQCNGAAIGVTASNGIAPNATATAALTVTARPVFTQLPLEQRIAEGGGATFTAIASGNPAPTYAWTLNGSPVGSGPFTAGACSLVAAASDGGSTLSLTGVTIGCDNALMQVTASNGIAPSPQASARLRVGLRAPVITQSPQPQTILGGTEASFTVVATANPAPTFTWTINGNPVGTGRIRFLIRPSEYCAVDTATANGGATLLLSQVSSTCDGATITVTAGNGIAPSATRSAVLTVNRPVLATTFATNPTTQQTTSGGGVTLRYQVAGPAGALTPKYVWSYIPRNTFVPAMFYYCLDEAWGQNSGNSIFGDYAPCSKLQNGSFTQNDPIRPAYGCTANVAIADSADGGSTLTLTNLSAQCDGLTLYSAASNVGDYQVNQWRIRITAPAAPQITLPPLAQSIVAGGGATFTVTATGAPAPTFAWTLNGAAVGSGAFSLGSCTGNAATSNGGATLSLTSVSAGCDGAAVAVTASNGVIPNAAASSTLAVTTPAAPAITAQPASATLSAGGSAALAVTFNGTPVPTAAWWYRSSTLPEPRLVTVTASPSPFTAGSCQFNASGTQTAGSATLSMATVTLGCDGAQIRAIATNSLGSATSDWATLTVNPPNVAPVITQPPLAQTITAGGGATFMVTATGTPAPTYAWTLNGTAVGSGAFTIGSCTGSASTSNGGATLSLTTVAQACNGFLVGVTASNAAGTTAPALATLTVNPPGVAPVITQPPLAQTITAGGGATFMVTATGTPAPTYAWTLNGTAVGSGAFTIGSCTGSASTSNGGATLSLTTVAQACNGFLVGVTASNAVGTTAPATAALTVNPSDVAVIISFGGTAPVGEGQIASVSVTATGNNLTYQWYLDFGWQGGAWREIPGATASTYTTPPLTPGYNEAYLVVKVCSGPQPAPSDFPQRCAFSNKLQLLEPTNPLGISGLCFGGPNGWCYGSPWPQGNELTGVVVPDYRFPDPNGPAILNGPLVAVGYGTVLESADFGVNWTMRVTSPRLKFVGLARTPDGSRLVAPVQATSSPTVVGGLYISDDGGANWSSALSLTAAAAVNDVSIAADGTGVAVGTSIWRSAGGGTGWTQVSTPALAGGETLTRVARIKLRGNVVLAVSDAGNILRSADGGATWNRVMTGAARMIDVAINIDNSGGEFAVALEESDFTKPYRTNRIFFSTDGGLTWSESPLDVGQRAVGARTSDYPLVVVDRNERTWLGRIVGGSTVFDYPPPPVDWTKARTVGRWRLAIQEVNREGFAVGQYGAMMRMGEQGGFHWAGGGSEGLVASGVGSNITAIESSGAGTATSTTLLVRDRVIYSSTDGGASWRAGARLGGQQRADAGANAVSLRDENTAFAVFTSDTGRPSLARSDDRGGWWYPVGDMPFGSLNGVEIFWGGLNGVLIGGDGAGAWKIFRTLDAATWSAVHTLAAQPLAVRALDPQSGPYATVLVGTADGKIIRSTDGGATWAEITPGATGAIRHIARINATTAILSADNGLWRSTDAGLTWGRVYDATAFGSMTAVAADPAGTKCVAVGMVGILTGDCLAAPDAWSVVDIPFAGEPLSASWSSAGNVLAGAKGGTLLINRNSGQIASAPPRPRPRLKTLGPPIGPSARAAKDRPQGLGMPQRARAATEAPVPPRVQADSRSGKAPQPTPPPLRIGPERRALLTHPGAAGWPPEQPVPRAAQAR